MDSVELLLCCALIALMSCQSPDADKRESDARAHSSALGPVRAIVCSHYNYYSLCTVVVEYVGVLTLRCDDTSCRIDKVARL